MVSLARKWLHEMFLYLTKVQSSKDLAGKFSCVQSNPWGVKLHDNLKRLQDCGARLGPAEMHSDHIAFNQMFGRFFCPYLLDSKVPWQITEARLSGRDADQKCMMIEKPYHMTSSKWVWDGYLKGKFFVCKVPLEFLVAQDSSSCVAQYEGGKQLLLVAITE